MDRRDFLKRSTAVAVAGAFPLPARATNPYWLPQQETGFAIASDTFMQAMEKCWQQCKLQPHEHVLDVHSMFCVRCGRAAEDVLDSGAACI